jgi:type IV secretory pathway TrbD component
VDGVVGVCVGLVWVDNPIGCMVWCVGVAVLRDGER